MASETPLRLPVLDFTKPGALNPGSAEWDSLKVQVREALKEYGCFEVVYNGLQPELRKSIFDALEELFDLPTDVKKLNVLKKPYHGYISTVSECMAIDCATIFEEVENYINILWPHGNPNLSKTIHSVCRQVAELEGIIRRMFLASLGVEKYLEEHMDSTNYLLRLLKYPPPKSTHISTQISLCAHTDKQMAAILFENEVEGLEIQNKQGDWTFIKIPSGSFIFLVGETFRAWSNGRVYNPIHRVRMRSGNTTRYSVGLFSVPKEDYIVKAPEELVDQEHPLLFKPFYYFEYIQFFLKAYEDDESHGIKDYCGI